MTDLNAGQPALLTTVSLTDFIAEFGEGRRVRDGQLRGLY